MIFFMTFLLVYSGVGLHILIGVELILRDGQHKEVVGVSERAHGRVGVVLAHEVLLPAGDVEEVVALEAKLLDALALHEGEQVAVGGGVAFLIINKKSKNKKEN